MPRYIVLVIALIIGGWMLFDGTRALTTGYYVTPGSGPYAGQLGPWATLVAGLGLDPLGLPLKILHIILGAAWLVSGIVFARSAAAGWWPLLLTALSSLWYLPFGTIAGVTVAGLLVTPALRSRR